MKLEGEDDKASLCRGWPAMNEQRFTGPSPLPVGRRYITWEIGEAELQKSVMADETFQALCEGTTNVVKIRTKIRDKRKLVIHKSTGRWTETADDRFVNEHAWVLAVMNEFGVSTKVNGYTKSTSLVPGAAERFPAVIEFFKESSRMVT